MERENVWIDEVEGEAAKLENTFWLRSPQDQQMVTALSQIKETLRHSDGLEAPEDEDYYDRLHDAIMAKVEVTEVAPPPKVWRRDWQSKKLISRWLGKGIGFASLSALTLVSAFLMRTQNSLLLAVKENLQEQQFIQNALGQSHLVAQITTNNQLDSEYFVDVARQGMDTLTQEQVDSLLGK